MNNKMKSKRVKLTVTCMVAVMTGMIIAGCGSRDGSGDAGTNQALQTESIESTQSADSQSAIQISVYAGNENADGFDIREVSVEALTPENILAALAENEVIPDTVKVLSFQQEEQSLTLDLSKEYQEQIRNYGTAGEMMAVGGVVNTFLDAYGAETITILVEGRAWDSGHVEYDGPMGRYELP